MLEQEVAQHAESACDGSPADSFPRAAEVKLSYFRAPFYPDADEHQPDRFIRSSAAGPGNAGLDFEVYLDAVEFADNALCA